MRRRSFSAVRAANSSINAWEKSWTLIGAAAPVCGPAPLAVGEEVGATPERVEVAGGAPRHTAGRRLEGAA